MGTMPIRAGELDSEEKVRLMAAAADAVRASDITVLDLRGLTIIADFFLICTGKSSIQIRAVADRIEEKLREHGRRKLRVEGYQEATWILLDYGDVVAHVMAAEQREFYDLEAFWAAAPRLPVEIHHEETALRDPRQRTDAPTE
jgi:ribosome-associated protein